MKGFSLVLSNPTIKNIYFVFWKQTLMFCVVFEYLSKSSLFYIKRAKWCSEPYKLLYLPLTVILIKRLTKHCFTVTYDPIWQSVLKPFGYFWQTSQSQILNEVWFVVVFYLKLILKFPRGPWNILKDLFSLLIKRKMWQELGLFDMLNYMESLVKLEIILSLLYVVYVKVYYCFRNYVKFLKTW